MKAKPKPGVTDILKAVRRANREAEIEFYGRPVGRTKVHKSKKVYDRKIRKTEARKLLPSSFSSIAA